MSGPQPELAVGGHLDTSECWEDEGTKIDYYCGLEGEVPEDWRCQIYYGTVFGDVRGCSNPAQWEYEATSLDCNGVMVRFFDGEGEVIGAYDTCPKSKTKECDKAGCGVAEPPEGWACRRETFSFGGLYGGERKVYVRCAAPGYEQYHPIKWGGKRCRPEEFGSKKLAILYDERGRPVDDILCGVGGSNGSFADWAGIEADAAERDINGEGPRPGESDSEGRQGVLPAMTERRSGGQGPKKGSVSDVFLPSIVRPEGPATSGPPPKPDSPYVEASGRTGYGSLRRTPPPKPDLRYVEAKAYALSGTVRVPTGTRNGTPSGWIGGQHVQAVQSLADQLSTRLFGTPPAEATIEVGETFASVEDSGSSEAPENATGSVAGAKWNRDLGPAPWDAPPPDGKGPRFTGKLPRLFSGIDLERERDGARKQGHAGWTGPGVALGMLGLIGAAYGVRRRFMA